MIHTAQLGEDTISEYRGRKEGGQLASWMFCIGGTMLLLIGLAASLNGFEAWLKVKVQAAVFGMADWHQGMVWLAVAMMIIGAVMLTTGALLLQRGASRMDQARNQRQAA